MKNIVLNFTLFAVTSLACMEKISIEKKDVLSSGNVIFKIEDENFSLTLEQAKRSKFIKEVLTLEYETKEAIPLPHITKKIWDAHILPELREGESHELSPFITINDLILITDQASRLNIPYLYEKTVSLLSERLKNSSTPQDEKKIHDLLAEEVQCDIAKNILGLVLQKTIYLKFDPKQDNVTCNCDGQLTALILPTTQVLIVNNKGLRPIFHYLLNKDKQLLTAIHPSERSIALAPDESGLIEVWNIEPKSLLKKKFVGHSKVLQLIFSPNGRFLISVSKDKIAVYDLESDTVNSISIQPLPFIAVTNNSKLLVINRTADVKVYDLDTCTFEKGFALKQRYFIDPETTLVMNTAYCTGRDILAVGFTTGTIDLYDLKQMPVENSAEPYASYTDIGTNIFSSLSFNNDGTMLAATGNKGVVKLYGWKKGTMRELQEVSNTRKSILAALFDKNNALWIFLYSSEIEVWDRLPLGTYPTIQETMFVHKAFVTKTLDVNHTLYNSLNEETKKILDQLIPRNKKTSDGDVDFVCKK